MCLLKAIKIENVKFIFSSVFCFFVIACNDETPDIPMSSKVLKEINEIRSRGCLCGSEFLPPASPLTWNDQLENAAYRHVIDMYERKYFSHITPEGISPKQRVEDAGYKGIYCFENIAKGYNSHDNVIDAWKKSESHCRAMMADSVSEIGVSRFNSFWVMELGDKE